MNAERASSVVVLLAIYGTLGLAVILLRGISPDMLGSLTLQSVVSLVALEIVTSKTKTATSATIDDYHTTTANALIGFGMILSAFTILRASNGDTISTKILSVAPSALVATATGIAGGTFFFILGHIRAARTARPDGPAPPNTVADTAPLAASLRALAGALAHHTHRMETMSTAIEQLGGIVSSDDGRSWAQIQANLAAPLAEIAAAIPKASASMQSAAAAHQAMSVQARQTGAALEATNQRLAISSDLLVRAEQTGRMLIDATAKHTDALTSAGGAFERVARSSERSIDTLSKNVTAQGETLAQTLHGVLKGLDGVKDSAVLAMQLLESAATTTAAALADHGRRIADSATTVAESAERSRTSAADVQAALSTNTVSVGELRAAITVDQRGLLAGYLERLGTSAAKIAEEVLRYVPSHVETLLANVERRIVDNADAAYTRAYRNAEEQFKALNDSAGVTVKRLSTIIDQFDAFNRAFEGFEEELRHGVANATDTATAFSDASLRLREATRQFTEAGAQHESPQTASLMDALTSTVDLISGVVREFSGAHSRLVEKEAQIRQYSAAQEALRNEADTLRSIHGST